MAATHDIFSVKVLTLDNSGNISESEITTLLEEKSGKERINVAAKHLGIQISPLDGDEPQSKALLNNFYKTAAIASEVTTGFSEYKKISLEHHGSSRI